MCKKKLNKKISPVASSVIALSCVATICVTLLSIANVFLRLSPDEAELRRINFLHSIISADSFEVLHDIDSDEKNITLAEFNQKYPESVLRVYRVSGGINDGIYIIESTAAGYNGSLTVVVVYNSTGTVRMVAVKESPPQEFVSKISFEMLNLLLRGRAGNVGTAQEFSAASTGATRTLNGIISAVNLANIFYERHLSV